MSLLMNILINYISLPLTLVILIVVATNPDKEDKNRIKEIVFLTGFATILIASQYLWLPK